MNKFETTKLFYNEYKYKLVIRNQLAHLFREKQFSLTKTHLDKLQQDFENGRRLILQRYLRQDTVDVADFQEAQILFNELTQRDDYKLRVENPRMQIYSNDKTFLEKLVHKLRFCLEYWEPSSELLIENNTVVLSRPMPFEYRVTLKSRTNRDFARWYESNKSKVKIGRVCLEEIQKGGYTNGLYFYVRNERILNLIMIIIGNNISRIDKVVYKQKLDK